MGSGAEASSFKDGKEDQQQVEMGFVNGIVRHADQSIRFWAIIKTRQTTLQ